MNHRRNESLEGSTRRIPSALLRYVVPVLAAGTALGAAPSGSAEIAFPAAPGEPVALIARFGQRACPLAVGTVPGPGADEPTVLSAALPAALAPWLGTTRLELGTGSDVFVLADAEELARIAVEGNAGRTLRLAVEIRALPGDHGSATAELEVRGFGDAPARSDGGAAAYRFLPPGVTAAALTSGPCGGGAIPVVPTEGGVGTPVVLDASLCSLLGTYDVDDVVMVGRDGLFGRATALEGRFAVAQVEHLGPFAEPSRPRFLFGAGEQHVVPPLGSVSYPDGVFSLRRTTGEPSFRTKYVFHPEVEGIFVEDGGFQGLPRCADPQTYVDLRLRLDEDGCLRVRLPGAGTCLNDKVSFRMAFRTPAYANVVVILPSTTLLAEWTWSIASAVVLFPLNIALASSNCVATYDAGSNEIVICSGDGSITSFNPGSYVRIDFDPALHSVFSELQGVIDDYDLSNGLEPTTPHAVFTTGSGNPPQRNYDTATINQWLMETFDAFGDSVTDGPARSAKIEVHMRGVGELTYTDNINFGWDEIAQVYDWTIRHIDIPVLGYQWIPGQEATLCFDLSELPDRFGDPVPHNILDRLEQDVIHVALTDDTDVDYLVLKVLRCTH